MTATFRTDALMCDCCGVELPKTFLVESEVTGGFVCLACREKGAPEAALAEGSGYFGLSDALAFLPISVVLEGVRAHCREQCGPGWTAREQALAAVCALLGEAAAVARGLE